MTRPTTTHHLTHSSSKTNGILVVDDEPSLRSLLQIFLSRQGYEVFQAANGKEGVDLYIEQQDRISLILMDIQMPEMDGIQAFEVLKKYDPNVICCFVTGDAGIHRGTDLEKLGAAFVMDKPFALAELSRVIRQLLGIPFKTSGNAA